MKLLDIYRSIKAGKNIEGWTLEGNILYNDSQCWSVSGIYRLHFDEVPHPKNIPLDRSLIKNPEPIKKEYVQKICQDCGAMFVCSKFNPDRTRCTECDRKYRIAIGQDKAKVCTRCGKTFYISKYRPYSNPQICPACNQKIKRVERIKRVKLVNPAK